MTQSSKYNLLLGHTAVGFLQICLPWKHERLAGLATGYWKGLGDAEGRILC